MNADERGLKREKKLTQSAARSALYEFINLRSSAFICGFILFVGCSTSKPTTQPTTIRERQDAALKDPFGYSVDVNKERDVSGGGIFELDKEGLKKDLDHALNP